MTDQVAESGSITDIQTAVNICAATGGGNVTIPAGDFTFNPPTSGTGVTVPGGVNLIGAGKGVTILRETEECVGSLMVMASDAANTENPIKIQGISFIGYVPSRANADSVTNNAGVQFHCVKDFIVYNCAFGNFVNACLGSDNNDGMAPPQHYCRGVFSHCDFDQPYKDDLVIENRIWGYGIIVTGLAWDSLENFPHSDIRIWYGHYNDLPKNVPVTYIEDCTFRRCRHSIAGGTDSECYYVARHNTFIEMIQFGYGTFLDNHPGGHAVEIYDNDITGYPVDARGIYSPLEDYIGLYLDRGIGIRGGEALIYNNEITDCPTAGNYLYETIEGNKRVKNVYIWNNTITYPNAGSGNDLVVDVGITEYHLHEPTMEDDGFTYTPYTYPHPLVGSASAIPVLTNFYRRMRQV